MRKANLQIGTGLKSILMSIVFSFLANIGFTLSIPTESYYLGQTPSGNTPKIFPLSVKQGFFAAERIAISNDGSWTNPANFGPVIDFGLGSWGPYVTPDNKYLFYSTGTKWDYSDVHVYWVRIDGMIDTRK